MKFIPMSQETIILSGFKNTPICTTNSARVWNEIVTIPHNYASKQL